jgi:hypothetical protein
MTWAINEGGQMKKEVFEFLTNIGIAVNAKPSASVATLSPIGPYAPDLLPLMQQMAWAAGEPVRPQAILTFLQTVAYYLALTGPIINPGPYQRPTIPPTPPALRYFVPSTEIPSLFQVAFWLINDGSTGNQQAWNFITALGQRLIRNNPLTTASGPYYYPSK